MRWVLLCCPGRSRTSKLKQPSHLSLLSGWDYTCHYCYRMHKVPHSGEPVTLVTAPRPSLELCCLVHVSLAEPPGRLRFFRGPLWTYT